MGLSKEKVEELLHGLENEQERCIKTKNLNGIWNCYHPHATLIHKGVKVSYGEEEIKKVFEGFFGLTEEAKVKPLYAAEADNGEYLIRRGTYTIGGNPKEFAFEQIYKKLDGKYRIYHDEFEFST